MASDPKQTASEKARQIEWLLTEKLVERGHTVSTSQYGSLTVDDKVDVAAVLEGAGRFDGATGTVRLVVGDYGARKQFPETKSGLPNLDKAVAEIESKILRKGEADKRYEQEQLLYTQAQNFNKKNNTKVLSRNYKGFAFTFESVTLEQAQQLLDIAHKLGIV